MILAIYNNSDYSAVYKDDLDKAFQLPGEYFVFSFDKNTHSNNKIYKDPFIYHKNINETSNFRIKNFELIDTNLKFLYNYRYEISFTFFNHSDQTTRQIIRSNNYSAELYKNELIFVISTLILLGKTESWEELRKIEELDSMQNKIKAMELEINNLKNKLQNENKI